MLLSVYAGTPDIPSNSDQGAIAHDLYGCLLRSTVPSQVAHFVDAPGMVPIRVLGRGVSSSSQLFATVLRELRLDANGGSVYANVFGIHFAV